MLVWVKAPPRRQLWSNNQGSGRSSAGGMAQEERSAWDGSSTSSHSPSFSSTDDSEVAVVAGKSVKSPRAEIASVKSPRAPTPSADDSHGVVSAVGTSASSVVSSGQVFVFFLSFFRRRERALSATFPSVMV